MRLNFLIILTILIVAIGGSAYFEDQAPSQSAQIERENKAPPLEKKATLRPLPAFSLHTLDGKDINENTFLGKTIIMNFWASWCTPCLAEFPVLLDIAEENHTDTILLAISSDEERADIDRYVKKIDRKQAFLDNVIIAHDADKKVTQDIFQTYRLPETIIINPAGQMVEKIIGVQWTKSQMQAIIAQTRQESQ